jgi:hypothetical protein
MLRAVLRPGRVGLGSSAWLVALGAPLLLILPGVARATPATLSTPVKTAVPALYPTRAEAEKAARLHFHCTGAHRMGDQWMPCALHDPAQRGSHP